METFLNIPTLLTVGAIIGVCISISLLLMWLADRRQSCTLTWSVSFAIGAAMMLLSATSGLMRDAFFLYIANAMLLFAFGINWYGFRQFVGDPPPRDLLLAVAGGLIWLVTAPFDPLADNVNLRGIVTALLILSYLVGVLAMVRRQMKIELLPSLPLTALLFLAHAGMQIARIVRIVLMPQDPSSVLISIDLFTRLRILEAVIFAIFGGLLQLTLIGQQAELRFRHAAETDDLTGLSNRRKFLDRVESYLEMPDATSSLVLFDIDHFKAINDTHGHEAGDAALVAFSNALSEEVRHSDLLARIGGEEFALFLPGLTAQKSCLIAERVCRRIREAALHYDGTPMRLTVSAGVASIEDAGATYSSLHRATDMALYEAKRAGRDRVVRFRRPDDQRSLSITEDMTPSLVI